MQRRSNVVCRLGQLSPGFQLSLETSLMKHLCHNLHITGYIENGFLNPCLSRQWGITGTFNVNTMIKGVKKVKQRCFNRETIELSQRKLQLLHIYVILIQNANMQKKKRKEAYYKNSLFQNCFLTL